jgi:hypothetical protein
MTVTGLLRYRKFVCRSSDNRHRCNSETQITALGTGTGGTGTYTVSASQTVASTTNTLLHLLTF